MSRFQGFVDALKALAAGDFAYIAGTKKYASVKICILGDHGVGKSTLILSGRESFGKKIQAKLHSKNPQSCELSVADGQGQAYISEIDGKSLSIKSTTNIGDTNSCSLQINNTHKI